MRSLYLDCAYGLGGDMVLAGLAGLGVDFAPLQHMLHGAGIAARLEVHDVCRSGVAGRRMDVVWDDAQPLRHLSDLTDILERMPLSSAVRGRAVAALCRLAEAEAAVHGVPVERVHFHEVGAIDTLADVAGCFWALEQLAVDEVVCSPLPWFTGTVECAHGTMPLPAPATLRLLEGKPVYPTRFTQEMITPTGALLVDALVDRFADGPEGVLLRSGLGYGSRDSGGGMRVLLLEARTCRTACAEDRAEEGLERDEVVQLESNIDHLSGEELGYCFGVLMDAGALDVLYLPGVMKKNRPGGVLRVLCEPARLAGVQEAFFRHTHTLGIRRTRVERVLVQRRGGVRETRLGPLETKEYTLGDVTVSRPEHEALAAFARKSGRSLPELRAMLFGQETPGDGSPE